MVLKSKPFLTARDKQNELCESKDVCIGTVKRYLRVNRLFTRVVASKAFLSKQNIQRRRKWCLAKKCWTGTKWSKIIFSGKTRLKLVSKSRCCGDSVNQLNTRHYFRLYYQKYTIQDFLKQDGTPSHRSTSTRQFIEERRIRTFEN